MKKLIFGIFLSLALCGSASAESHTTTGVIEHVENNGITLVIKHEDFPDFMGAMTMPFDLLDSALSDGLKTGDRVKFTIQKTDSGYPIVKISKIGGS
ncbi:MAG: copper-binding protein [Gammaproteobacteria bacterium]|nr:copper-binding protein [Gammaproteobacteria bacterium]MCP4978948.1 copper-binding protein [Gammaproteobacteria bacterium]